MKISLDQLKKAEFTRTVAAAALPPEQMVLAIVKVNQPLYVPPGVQVRSRMDDLVFTASMRAEVLSQVESDPKVVSVALSKALGMIE